MDLRAARIVLRIPGPLPAAESAPQSIGHINRGMKATGKRSAGKLHAAFDEAGAGNVVTGAGLRPKAKAMEQPPDPKNRRASSRPYRDRRPKPGPRQWHSDNDFRHSDKQTPALRARAGSGGLSLGLVSMSGGGSLEPLAP